MVLETLMNLFRAVLWTSIALALVGVLSLAALGQTARLWGTRSGRPKELVPLLFTILSAIGPVGICGLYHIPHPGYVAPAIPAFFALAAYAGKCPLSWPGRLLPWFASFSAAFWMALWFVPSFSPAPTTKNAVVWNAFVGQYTREARLQSTWKSLSSWLLFSGQAESVPERRKENLKLDRRFQ